MFKVKVYKIIPGTTQHDLEWESPEFTNRIDGELAHTEKVVAVKKDAGYHYGFGDMIDVVLENMRTAERVLSSLVIF